MGISKQHGFTIMELTLFFAVSGLLFLTVLSGIGLAVQRQRFSDSVNGTQSYLQLQYNESRITINDRENNQCGVGSGDRGASDCLIVGKIVDLGSGSGEETVMKSYPVIVDEAKVKELFSQSPSPTLLEVLSNSSSGAKAIRSSADESDFNVPWQAMVKNIKDSGGQQSVDSSMPTVRYIAIIQSPENGGINTFRMQETGELFSFGSEERSLYGAGGIVDFDNPDADASGSSDDKQSIKACIQSADMLGMKALLKITKGISQDAVTTQFDSEERVQWCG